MRVARAAQQSPGAQQKPGRVQQQHGLPAEDGGNDNSGGAPPHLLPATSPVRTVRGRAPGSTSVRFEVGEDAADEWALRSAGDWGAVLHGTREPTDHTAEPSNSPHPLHRGGTYAHAESPTEALFWPPEHGEVRPEDGDGQLEAPGGYKRDAYPSTAFLSRSFPQSDHVAVTDAHHGRNLTGGRKQKIRGQTTTGEVAATSMGASTSPAITAEMMGKGVGVPPWERIRLYMPRAVLEESSGLRVALVLEVDADEGYWQHFTTRHDAERYMVTKDSLEQALAKDFTNHASVKDALRKGGAGTGSAPHGASHRSTVGGESGATTGTPTGANRDMKVLSCVSVFERSPPARLGAFEVTLLVNEVASGRTQAVLLHSKLNTSRFPSVHNIVQRIHNILGSKRASYRQVFPAQRVHPYQDPAKSPPSHGKSPKSHRRRSKKRAPTPQHHHNPPSLEQPPPSTRRNRKYPCELCLQIDYDQISPIWDRFNYHSRKEHSFPSTFLHRTQEPYHTAQLTRYAVRWVGSCCYDRCARCGWIYLQEANHDHACLPYSNPSSTDDAEAVQDRLTRPKFVHNSLWGDTRFSCRYIPSTDYSPHVRLDPTKRMRRVYVDVVDVLQPNVSYDDADVLMFNETNGQRVPADQITQCSVVDIYNHNLAESATSLHSQGSNASTRSGQKRRCMYAFDLWIPGVYSLRVLKQRYLQHNWLEPFHVSYYGPMVMCVEISFESRLRIEVVDLEGRRINASVLLKKHYYANDQGDRQSVAVDPSRAGQSWDLGNGLDEDGVTEKPRELTVDVPHHYTIEARLDGYTQLTHIRPLLIDYRSWGVGTEPVTIKVCMLRFGITFSASDSFEMPLEGSRVTFTRRNPNQADAGVGTLAGGSSAAYARLRRRKLECYELQTATQHDEEEDVERALVSLTLPSLLAPDNSNNDGSISGASGSDSQTQSGPAKEEMGEEDDRGEGGVDRYDDVRRFKHWTLECQYDDYEVVSMVLQPGSDLEPLSLSPGQMFPLTMAHWLSDELMSINTNMDEPIQPGEEDELRMVLGVATHTVPPVCVHTVLHKCVLNVHIVDSLDDALFPVSEGDGGIIELIPSTAEGISNDFAPRVQVKVKPTDIQQAFYARTHVDSTGDGSGNTVDWSAQENRYSYEEFQKLKGWYLVTAQVKGYDVTGVTVDGEPLDGAINFEKLWRGGKPYAEISVTVRYRPVPVMDSHEVIPPVPFTNAFDIAFVIDATGSMGKYIKSLRESLHGLTNELSELYPKQNVRLGVVAYRDVEFSEQVDHMTQSFRPANSPELGEDPHAAPHGGIPVEICPFTDDLHELSSFLDHLEPYGGNDIPEDLLGGLHTAIDLDWRASIRMCVVITDAPCHGKRFHGLSDDAFPEEPGPHGLLADEVLARMKNTAIRMFFLKISAITDTMVTQFKRTMDINDTVWDEQTYTKSLTRTPEDGDGGGNTRHPNKTPSLKALSGVNPRLRRKEARAQMDILKLAERLRDQVMSGLHNELKYTLCVKWHLPPHPTFGNIRVKHFELQHRHSLFHDDWISVKILANSSSSGPSGNGRESPPTRSSPGARGGHAKHRQNGKGKALASEPPPPLQQTYYMKQYAAGSAEYRVRVLAMDGYLSEFSNELEASIDLSAGPDEDETDSDKMPAVRKVTVVCTEFIESVAMEYVDESSARFPHTAAAVTTDATGGRRTGKRSKNTRTLSLELQSDDKIIEVSGHNDNTHCLRVAFRTSKGVTKAFAGRRWTKLEASGMDPQISDPFIKPFHFPAAPLQWVCGLVNGRSVEGCPRIDGIVEERTGPGPKTTNALIDKIRRTPKPEDAGLGGVDSAGGRESGTLGQSDRGVEDDGSGASKKKPKWKTKVSSTSRECFDEAGTRKKTVWIISNDIEPPVGLTLHWVDDDSREKKYFDVGPGEAQQVDTHVGHVWILRTEDGELVSKYVTKNEPEQYLRVQSIVVPPAT